MGKHDHFEDRMLAGGTDAIVQAGHFFMRDDPVHESLRRISSKLETLGIPYAIAGGMALVAHGYDRTTVDIDVVLKLASGMTNPGRLKDLADVQELIRCLRLPDDFSRQLHVFVGAKYLELWQSVQDHPADIDPPRRV